MVALPVALALSLVAPSRALFQTWVAPTRTTTITTTTAHVQSTTRLFSTDNNHYYGSSSYMIKEFSLYEDLEEIVRLASQPIPQRPDGIVVVARYTSATRPDCRATEANYERLARENPATVFLRCMEEYDSAALLLGQANIQNWPTVDVFYGGQRVARVEGSSVSELEEVLNRYQMQNSALDLFSESSDLKWGDGSMQADALKQTPKTTNRFVPGYDWNKDGGFFDEQGSKAQESFEEMFGNWLPNMDDDDDVREKQ